MEKEIEYFIMNPQMMYRGTKGFIKGKWASGIFKGKTPLFIKQCKNKARQIIYSQQETEKGVYTSDLETLLVEKIENDKQANGGVTYKFISVKSLSAEELDELVQVDNINFKRGQTWHKFNPVTNKWSYSISVMPVAKEVKDFMYFSDEFKSFISTFKYQSKLSFKPKEKNSKQKGILIFPKQDAHFNKADIYGNNDIQSRFDSIIYSYKSILEEAFLISDIENIFYVVGSDQFNSEWTSLTTKGTPQDNVGYYQEMFKVICSHEIEVLELFSMYSSKIKVIFTPGNHDEYVGWHLIHWLEAYFRNVIGIQFETTINATKCFKYSNSGIMLNHGDVVPQKDLISHFPNMFKQEWSNCDNYYIFSGDKHYERSIEKYGVTCYQVPAMSLATGKWDDKHLWRATPEIQVFLIKKDAHLTNIFKRKL